MHTSGGSRKRTLSANRFLTWLPGNWPRPTRARDEALFNNPGSQVYESSVERADGSRPDVIFHKATFSDASGRAAGLIGVILDITERKKSEEERETLRRQLSQTQKMEAIGTLTGGIAHDFNNLLTIINGYAELMLLEMTEDAPLYPDLQKDLRNWA